MNQLLILSPNISMKTHLGGGVGGGGGGGGVGGGR